MNKSNELRGLFKKTMMGRQVNKHVTQKVIYFYEWSDPLRKPIVFLDSNAFERFLRDCGIGLLASERNLVDSLGFAFVSCFNGTKSLAIHSTYNALRESLDRHMRSLCT